MPTYGGTDTTNLAQAEGNARSQRLKAQMDTAQQQNEEFHGYMNQAGGALQGIENRAAQKDENDKNRQLEAARSGLEFDPGTKKYIESGPAAEARQFKEGATVANYNLEKDKATSDVLQRQQQLNQQGEQQRTESGLRTQHSALEMAKTKLDTMREERLNIKAGQDYSQAMVERDDKINLETDKMLNNISENMVKLEMGDSSAKSETMAIMGKLAAMDPSANKAYSELQQNPGAMGPESGARLRSAFQEMRTAVAISTAARTGYISGMVDPTSPTMQRFYQVRQGATAIMEDQMSKEFQYLQSLPEEQRAQARKKLHYSSMSQEERMLDANKAGALMFQLMTQGGYGAGGGQQNGTGTGAGPAGPQQQTKLGGSRPQQQPQQSGQRPGGSGQPKRGGGYDPNQLR